MMRRHKVYTICLLFVASILLIINIKILYTENSYYLTPIKIRKNEEIDLNDENGNETIEQQTPIILDDDTQVPIKMENIPKITNESHFFGVSDLKNNNLTSLLDEIHSSSTITKLIKKARLKIKSYNYTFWQSGFRGLENSVMETGGMPLISLVVSTWRSGSTFTADLINHMRPSTYFLNEPLYLYGTKHFRTLKEASEALSLVKRVLKCNYKGLENYLKSKEKYFGSINRNTTLWSLWQYCNYEGHVDLCYDVEVTTRLCRLFPFQNVKLERIRLRLVEEIMKDKELNVKVILLVRDPRGVMQSRGHEDFCDKSSDCLDPSMLCADMISDYVAAERLLPQYPDRLMVIRFEELALQPNNTSDRILNFLNVKRTQAFDEFLQSHTNIERAGAYATSRVSRNVPYKWKTMLSFNKVNEIQMSCREAMRMWGYKVAHNETHMTSQDFNPVEDYTFFL